MLRVSVDERLRVSLKRAGARVLIVLVSIAVTLLILELGFRVFNPQKHFTVRVHDWDKELGLKHIPGAKGHLISPEFNTNVSINSKGLRDREYGYSKPDGTKRILCLGDSFTFGYGVRAEETFPKVLERSLNAGRMQSTKWEVINAGVCCAGTAHQLAYFDTEGQRYGPDIVVLCICGRNDFTDNTRSWLYSVDDGKLVKHTAHVGLVARLRYTVRHLPGYSFVFAKSHLLTFVKRRLARCVAAGLAETPGDPASAAAADTRAFELTEHLLLALNNGCERRNCRLVVMVVPRSDAGGHPEPVADLIASVKKHGILYADLAPRFSEETRCGTENYYPLDGHWNAQGHRLAAQLLYGFLIDQGLVVDPT